MISIQNISFSYRRTKVLHDISFDIEPGKIHTVLGINGAGKSTLLEILTAHRQITEGRIIWDDQDIQELSTQNLARRRSVLSQKFDLGFPLNVKQLVEMGLYAVDKKCLSQDSVSELVTKSLSDVNMQDFKYRSFNQLSGGEQKRVLLAKSLCQLYSCSSEPGNKYLFLDEPSASLDIRQSHEILRLICTVAKENNIGVFMILHDLNLASQYSDELIILDSGKVMARGVPEKVLTKENLKQSFQINSIISRHPIYECPHVTSLPS